MNNKVAIYVRVSTDEQAKEGYSLSAQENVLVNYCKSKNYTIYKIYRDEGISAKDTIHRPSFLEMIADADMGKFTIILIWKLSRFTRNLFDLTRICEKLFKNKVYLISYSENFDCTSPAGRLLLNILGTTAQFEREVISENVKLGLDERAKQGYHTFAAALGYDIINSKKLKINSKEAKQVCFIFNAFIEYESYTVVSNICIEKGYLGKRGKKQSPQSVSVILTRPLYAGYFLHNGELHKGNHKAIISVDTFNKVQELVKKRGLQYGKKRKLYIIK